jgi:hypothetical protein
MKLAAQTRGALGLVLLAALAALAAAQTPTENRPPGLEVLGLDWKYAGYQRAETVGGNESIPNNDASTSVKLSRKTIYVFKYTAKATLKNKGAKAVKAISWDFVFTDARERKELKRFKLQSKQQIPPGETQTISRDIGLDPKEDTRRLNSAEQSIEITRIDYADGSTWKRQ